MGNLKHMKKNDKITSIKLENFIGNKGPEIRKPSAEIQPFRVLRDKFWD